MLKTETVIRYKLSVDKIRKSEPPAVEDLRVVEDDSRVEHVWSLMADYLPKDYWTAEKWRENAMSQDEWRKVVSETQKTLLFKFMRVPADEQGVLLMAATWYGVKEGVKNGLDIKLQRDDSSSELHSLQKQCLSIPVEQAELEAQIKKVDGEVMEVFGIDHSKYESLKGLFADLVSVLYDKANDELEKSKGRKRMDFWGTLRKKFDSADLNMVDVPMSEYAKKNLFARLGWLHHADNIVGSHKFLNVNTRLHVRDESHPIVKFVKR